jgi:hypothetical protein
MCCGICGATFGQIMIQEPGVQENFDRAQHKRSGHDTQEAGEMGLKD